MTSVPRVKICGITTREDAWTATRLGADGLGFLVGLLYHSEDQLSASAAGKIIEALPPFVSATLVTHQADLAELRALCREARPQVAQLHGSYPLEHIQGLRDAFPAIKIIKAVHVDGEPAIEVAAKAARFADAVLLDTKTATRIGGTGVTHDWSISRRIRDALAPTPVILAGGLTPANVAAAVEQVHPYAVDVNSGVSIRRGRKSAALVEAFIGAAKRAGVDRSPVP
jgi:phosphoribosylanthranilate isomerase